MPRYGLASDHTMWDVGVPALTARYRVLRVGGRGASTPPIGAYPIDDLAGDVIAVMDHHGWSGRSSWACRSDAPDVIRRAWDERFALVTEQGTEGLVDGTLERWLTTSFRAAQPEASAKLASGIRGTSDQGHKDRVAVLKRFDCLKDLGSIGVPTLDVAGTKDSSIPMPVMVEMATLTPGARFAAVRHAAHIINVNQSEGLAPALDGFRT